MTDKIERLKDAWQTKERLEFQHKQASEDARLKAGAWNEECFEAADLYNQLHLVHEREHKKAMTQAVLLQDKLKRELAESVPKGAERLIPYLEYIGDEGYLTYDQWLGIIEEQERNGDREQPELLDASEDSTPF